MLSLNDLQIRTPNKILLDNLSLTLLPSAIVYLQGPNGCGKTSLLKTIAGIQKPSKGLVTFGKHSYPMHNVPKPYCAYIGHNLGLKPELTVIENLKFWPEFYESSALLEASVYYFKLEELLYKKCYELSAGNQKKVALCRLMSCQSKLWLLDEIDSNLDEENKQLLLHLILSKANNGGIIFISTHGKVEIPSALTLNIQDYAS